ncbi:MULTISPECIES: TAXI family TRAP transporter solute-binding subunit [Bradyrhizobium]|jgi:TRAP transporter TAXI family solute receptor|uniref:TRAP transporter TAXI family solute receptor n=1 Tax=Bradyrhizobium elkanii TaxID=29448 RepID=A0A8I1Y5F6_BRAEL|nr:MULTISPECIES: TAXI family TRAP transporter solute-binding subunit [Bradyrhizobium]MBP1292256.1 TRAP transporter TAXI family solute receptor [Bradyrhizobium elkanii]MCP1927247.1 TRAP transporter TAXI family solute receptor [Bradyrhizobium elkanii]MCS3475235.1 TRAP transporter TAXI family solute receptor [Bradyrhizobium elkanii]MCS3582074.1 TRAP transporter TAXI family solute receptor [Bradyrhizobium elkanii]MCS3715641.1 TRAP transporter TAXI family solute receptor [Bradyrhizobium elkanii]
MTDGSASMSPKPLRSAKRRLMFVLIAGALAIIGTLMAGYYFAVRPVTLRIAVGPANSDDLKVVQALAQAFNNQQQTQVKLRPVQTEGATASAQTLADGKADLAIIRGDLEVPKNAQAVATLRKNVVVMWVPPAKGKVRKSARITKIAQLAGRKIGVVGRTPANVNLLKLILTQYGVDPMKVEIVQFPANEAAEAIRNLKADAYLAVGPANSKITIDAITASVKDGGEPSFLAIDASEAIAQNHPAYEAAEIPAGSLGSADRPDDEVKTISFSHHIVARKGLSDSTVAAFTRQLFAIRQSLKTDFPLAAKIETPDTDKDATIPVHPGAAAFVDGEEKTFLDRYSDYIWWSLMAFSAMGSAGAWFAGYLKQDERNTNTSQRERLLEMLKAARQSDSIEELDQMQAEADDILRHTLDCFEHGAIEEGTLTAFNIALEQLHNAVADRKALLFSMPQNLQRTATQFRAAGTA